MSDQFPIKNFLETKEQSNFFDQFLKGTEESEKAPANQAIPPIPTTDHDDLFSLEELSFINQEFLKNLKEKIPANKFNAYFENNFSLAQIKSEKLVFNISTDFIKTIIEKSYLEQLELAIVQTLGKKYHVDLKVSPGNQSERSENSSSSSFTNPKSVKEAKFKLDLNKSKEDIAYAAESEYISHVNDSKFDYIIDKNKTFDNFIIGPSNNLAYAATKAVASTPGKEGKYPCLYIYSSSGLGKTHLLHAVSNKVHEHSPHMRIQLITAREFLKEMIEYIKEKKLDVFQSKYSQKIDVLMIDDIHELSNKQGLQDEFFHIFNELYNRGKQLIFTSDKNPQEIQGLEERIKTRLQWGLVIDIQKPDIETRIAILKKKAYELDLFLPDDVINLIASSIKSSIRELEGSLIKLDAYSEVMGVDIDVEMIKDILQLTEEESSEKKTIESIAKVTASHYKIPFADLKSKARDKEITKARHVAMYLARKILKATQKEIGQFFGGRDHTSVIHGVNKIQKELKTDQHLSRDLIQIENNLQ